MIDKKLIQKSIGYRSNDTIIDKSCIAKEYLVYVQYCIIDSTREVCDRNEIGLFHFSSQNTMNQFKYNFFSRVQRLTSIG
jgi:hypothetical protein